jgi:hypothetical protein
VVLREWTALSILSIIEIAESACEPWLLSDPYVPDDQS